MKAYVRVCPVCETENPPEQLNCECGTLLAGVDFSLRIPEIPPEPLVSETSLPVSPGGEVRDSVASGFVVCPAPDCGQSNPVDVSRCLYCNRPLSSDSTEFAAFAPSLSLLASRSPVVSRINLPSDLAQKYSITSELQASGSEADLLVVEPLEGGAPLVAKLYRRGIQPDQGLMARLTQVGSHVVHFAEYGISDGVAWELMEYCKAGSLRNILQQGLISTASLHQIIDEIAIGLSQVHAHHILHRDLKPENILVRKRSPLSLVLTDFGIASIFEGTRHFTDGARTIRYAAPEALTGVIDAKSDWWSVGMILLEAASGKHPFAGLSEQVINHHLATRPVEVTGVVDEDIAQLCRGLLIRDPALRWGAIEVGRWRRGDPGLVLPLDTGNTLIQPYCIGEHEARSRDELAIVLARYWDEGVLDLKRGVLTEWVRGQLQDFNLNRRLMDIMESRDESDDYRLLRFLCLLAPKLPPVWKGVELSPQGVLSQARLALKGEREASLWLERLFTEGVLALFAEEGNETLGNFDKAWRQSLNQAEQYWESTRAAYQLWYRELGNQGQQKKVVNFDAAVYGKEAIGDFPSYGEWHPVVLLASGDPDYREALVADVSRSAKELEGEVPWFAPMVARLQDETEADLGVCIGVAYRLLGVARISAAEYRERVQRAIHGRRAEVAGLRREFMTTLQFVVPMDEIPDQDGRQTIYQGLDNFHLFSVRMGAVTYPDEDFQALLKQISSIQRLGGQLREALDAVEARGDMFSVLVRSDRAVSRLGLSLLFFLILWWIGVPGWVWLLLLGLGAGIFWRLFHRYTSAAKRLQVQWNLFRRQALSLLKRVKSGKTPISASSSGS